MEPGGQIGEFGRFLVTGGIAAGANIVSRWLLSHAVIYEIAVVFAYLIGMATAYALMRIFVFARSGRTVRDEATRFALVNVAALVQVWVVSVGLARLVFPWVGFGWYAEDIAHLIGVAVPAVTSYFGHRYFSFAAASGREGDR